MKPTLSRRRIPLATLITALVGLLAALVVSACNASASGASGGSARVSVSDSTLPHSVPKGFLGISMEETSLERYTGQNPAAIDPGFLGLLHNLQPSGGMVLRIGGDSTDWGWWPIPGVAKPAGIRFSLTPTFAAVARGTAEQIGGRLIIGVNLEANNRQLADYEAKELVSHIGTSALEAVELGNEPELYASFAWYYTSGHKGVPGRPKSSWTPAAYNSDFRGIAASLPNVPIAGPSSGGPEWLADLNAFAGSEPRVKLLTVHSYPLKGRCGPGGRNVASQLFLNSSLQGLANNIAGHVQIGYRHHLPVRVDEMNAITCGGQKGLSNAFAPALWALDFLPRIVETGAAGVNIHTIPNSTTQDVLMATQHGSTWSVGAQPEYYGMLAFAQAAPNGSHLLRVSSNDKNLDAWADKAAGGVEHVVLINTGSNAVTSSVSIAGASGSGSVALLQAPHGMLSTSGVTLGGQHVSSSTGALTGTSTATTVTAGKSGSYSVRVPGSSAAILTIG